MIVHLFIQFFLSLTPLSHSEPPLNKELIINVKGDSIAAYVMIASGNERKQTIIMVPGYPGNDNNSDIAHDLRREGVNVILFNHRGAWGSQGEYLYPNRLEDIRHIVNYLKNPSTAENLRIDTMAFTLIGRSLGGGVALIAGSQIEEITRIITMSTVNYGWIMENYNSLEELGGFKKYMKKQIMMNHDIDSFLLELLNNKNKFDIRSYYEELAKKKVLMVEDSSKNMDWIGDLVDIEVKQFETDHNFIDKREELSEYIIKWITSK